MRIYMFWRGGGEGGCPEIERKKKAHGTQYTIHSINNNVINKSSQHDKVPGELKSHCKGYQATTSQALAPTQEYGAFDPRDYIRKLDFYVRYLYFENFTIDLNKI